MTAPSPRLRFLRLARPALLAGVALVAVACHKTPLVAPSGTAMTLLAATNVLPVNGSVDVTAVLIEGSLSSAGTSGSSSTTAGGGTPVRDGTVVTFTTTLGRIEPTEARTANGRAIVKLVADGRSGVATITAFSGAATTTLDVNIGAAAASRLALTATPQSLPGTGGTSTIAARVEDEQGNGLAGVPVNFSTSKGSLSATSVISSDQGVATTSLTTTEAATVTATAGSATGTVSVTLKPRTTVAITAPASATVGVPASFTVTPGSGAIVTDATVDFGDGSSVSLGAITGATTVAHPFRAPGIQTVRVTVTDSEGGTGSASTQVAVAPLAVTLSFAPNSSSAPRVADVVTFTATPTTGALIDHYEWAWGDGQPGGSTVSGQVTHSYLSAGSYVASVKVVPIGNGTPATQLVTVDVKP